MSDRREPAVETAEKKAESIVFKLTEWTGSSVALTTALAVTIAWLVSGPFFHFSNTWQLVINTITSVATFLMVFVIQRSQNKDSLAINLKLNEIVAAVKGASNRLIAVENLTEDELKVLAEDYRSLVERVLKKRSVTESVTIESEGAAKDGSIPF